MRETEIETKTELPDGSLEVFVKGVTDENRIITEDDLIAKFGIDTEDFSLRDFRPNSWETHFRMDESTIYRATNFQAKATFVRNIERLTAEEVSKIFRELVVSHAPSYSPVKRNFDEQREAIAAIMDLFDLHIGMLAWAQETGDDSYDSHIGIDLALDAADHLISRLVGFNITKIIFPMGNDLLHVDNFEGGKGGKTTAGTPQDIDTRYLKMYRLAMQLMIKLIDRLRVIAPVEVVVVPGNHDRERMAYLGESIYAWYRKDLEVEVRNAAKLRKYTLFGKTLLGFTHGSEERAEGLPLIMASEEPRLWAEAEYRVFHTGHIHRKRKMLSVSTDTYNGVEVITLPSLVPPDAWHAQKGFVGGGRSAEVYLVGEDSGPCGYFRYNVSKDT